MLRLTYRANTLIPVEAECLTPDQLAGKSHLEIANLQVQHGNRPEALGDFFAIEGDASDHHLEIEGDCSRVKWIGANMCMGKIAIHGAAGMHLGSEMRGGEITVHGDTGDWVGAEMRGGRIHVHGNAGHLAGAAYRGSRFGMRGGALLIDGKAGNEIGATMRRGLIAVGGDVGDFAGVGMIAGSVFLFGAPGIRTGAGMKRGTVACFGGRAALLPTFKYDCTYRPTFLRLYLRQLKSWGFGLPGGLMLEAVERYSGDLLALGKGEILLQPGGVNAQA